MISKHGKTGLAVAAIAALCAAAPAYADTGRARLVGINEVPSISTLASGRLRFTIDENAGIMTWELSYSGLQADASQSHIHLGQQHTNGGIAVFLCSNIGGPAGTQACPLRSGTLSGVITAASVLGPTAQQLPAGGFAQLVRAIRAGATYANVHTVVSPTGEIRGQLKVDDGSDD